MLFSSNGRIEVAMHSKMTSSTDAISRKEIFLSTRIWKGPHL